MNRFKKTIIATGVVAIMATGMVNAGSLSYTAYTLGAFCANNHTGTHSKVTTDAYVTNSVTSVSNAKEPNFWVEALNSSGSYVQVSPDYVQKSGNTTKLNFLSKYSSSYAKKGKKIRLGMENNALSTTTGFVSGTVNFR